MKLHNIIQYVFIICLTFSGLHSNSSYCLPANPSSKSIKPQQMKIGNRTNDTLMLDYTFKDTSDRAVRLSDLKGKYVLVDLWYSGCGFCIYANKALRIVHEKMKNENIIFLSISVDVNKDKWIASITNNAIPSKSNPWAGKYWHASGTICLYTGGSGFNNDFLKKYNPGNSYPKLLFIDPSGKLISDHLPRPDYSGNDQPEKLIEFIEGYLKNGK
ncbi:TlpA family protein disulfide reductase [Mucilaginibacter flavidus]|uniref:TlpA family protein disulfide reductase n=1 Tax=Mucilaginibacter flavidus TaxID=2949309 RepID=UPI0020931599|nr:TlpA disulfide reductase family protein [Mucilaginibacter flavidus]MCO5950693.1 TlpA family protein disulfide reductase [Mucilaginibacter flavidus]